MNTQPGIIEPSFLEHKGKYKGLFSWIFSTDHKRIALLYLFSILTFFAIGATLGLLMKFELIAPGKTIMSPQAYNAFFTLHGIIMIFAVVIPGALTRCIVTKKFNPVSIDENPSTKAPNTAGSIVPVVRKLYGA